MSDFCIVESDSSSHVLNCPTGIAYSHFCLWEFDARLIHMHGLGMTRSLRLAAVRLLWRAAAATCDDS